MHQQTLSNLNASQAEAYRLFLFSISPLGLFGVSRFMSGKDWETWAAIFQLYLFLVVGSVGLHPLIVHGMPGSVTGFEAALRFLLGLAVLAHVWIVVDDACMFYRIDQYLRQQMNRG